MLSASVLPSLDVNFVAGDATGDSRVTVTRAAGGATYFDSTGTQQLASVNTQRIDYNPSTLANNGLLVEESRIQSIRNPRAEGAIAGTPGTQPTNWTTFSNVTTGGTITIGTPGTENGIPYVDYTFAGTATNSATTQGVIFETNTAIAALTAQIWSESFYIRLTAGAIPTGALIQLNLVELTSAGVQTAAGQSTLTAPTGAGLATQRGVLAYTLTGGATTANLSPRIKLNYVSAIVSPFTLTLRVGAPQVEQGNFASSTILPAIGTPIATTRAQDNPSMVIGAGFVQGIGSCVIEAAINANNGGNQWLFDFSDGTTTNPIRAYYSGGYNWTAGSLNNFSGGTATIAVPFKFGMAWNASGMSASSNGGAASTTVGTTPYATVSTLELGLRSSTIFAFDGYIRRLRYWPRSFGVAELQQATV